MAHAKFWRRLRVKYWMEAIYILLGIVGVSAGLGGWISWRKPVATPVKVMAFVGYFWLLNFIQLMVAAGAYYAWRHF